MGKTALVLGATGLVGSELVKILLESSEYKRVVLWVRKYLDISDKKLEQNIIDFEKLEDYRIEGKVDHVFCCLGTTIKKAKTKEAFKKVDLEYPLALGNWAKANDVSQFLVITAMGANANSKIFYNQIKGQIEQALREIDLNALVILRPSLLLGERNDFRFGEILMTKFFKYTPFIFSGPIKRYKPIEAKIVAIAMYRIAIKEKKGAYVYSSNEISQMGN